MKEASAKGGATGGNRFPLPAYRQASIPFIGDKIHKKAGVLIKILIPFFVIIIAVLLIMLLFSVTLQKKTLSEEQEQKALVFSRGDDCINGGKGSQCPEVSNNGC